jgi:hypothetical protein
MIPDRVSLCKELEPMARLLYGMINALTFQQGYCWAENKHFEELYGVDRKTINRWMSSLEKLGFIEITYENEVKRSGRKIYTLESNSNNPYPRTKMSPPPDKNVPPIYRSNNTTNKTTNVSPPKQAPRQAASPVVVSASLEKKLKEIPKMSKKLFDKVTSEHTEQELERAYKFTEGPNVENRIAIFQAALRDKYVPGKEKIDPRKFVNEKFVDGNLYNGAECQISPSGILFLRGRYAEGARFEDPKFFSELRKALETLKIDMKV